MTPPNKALNLTKGAKVRAPHDLAERRAIFIKGPSQVSTGCRRLHEPT